MPQEGWVEEGATNKDYATNLYPTSDTIKISSRLSITSKWVGWVGSI
jgi:hypothetical protein